MLVFCPPFIYLNETLVVAIQISEIFDSFLKKSYLLFLDFTRFIIYVFRRQHAHKSKHVIMTIHQQRTN